MNWLPISTSARTAPEFIGSEPVQRATWLCLMLYCAEHETGGVIRDCASWGDRRWMQTVGCTKLEALLQTDLYRFVKNDLVLWGYDPKYEDVIRAKRRGGHVGGKLSGALRNARGAKTPSKDSFKDSLNGGERRGEEGREEVPSGEGTPAGARGGDVTNMPPRTVPELRAMSEAVGMPDFDGWLAYWTALNWIATYGGVEHRMLPREVQKSMLNWKSKAREIDHENAQRKTNRGQPAAHGKRPATYLKSPDGKYTPEKCGF